MEPITHLMTGACLARSGFNRKAAYATAAMTLAAELPDIDTLWSIDGPIASFQHHRGWTHTFLGLPFEAAFITGCFWLFHRWRTRRRPTPAPPHSTAPQNTSAPKTAPPNWLLLFCFSLIGLLSHLFLDWTNNYGLRPFFPFNPRWYAGSFVFIFEPVLFLILLIALIAPSLFGLINSEVGARKSLYRGRGFAIAALVAAILLWTWRYTQHEKAVQLAQAADYNQATVLRVSANPYPVNPFRWHTVAETPMTWQLATVNTRSETVDTTENADTLFKPPTTLATLVAKRTWLGEAYLDWSSWPVVTDTGATPDGITTVTFQDLRFLYDTTFLAARKNPPLTGTVSLNADRSVTRMTMDGRPQH